VSRLSRLDLPLTSERPPGLVRYRCCVEGDTLCATAAGGHVLHAVSAGRCSPCTGGCEGCAACAVGAGDCALRAGARGERAMLELVTGVRRVLSLPSRRNYHRIGLCKWPPVTAWRTLTKFGSHLHRLICVVSSGGKGIGAGSGRSQIRPRWWCQIRKAMLILRNKKPCQHRVNVKKPCQHRVNVEKPC
jgi:hypothetical protein